MGEGGSGKSEVLSSLRLMPEIADSSVVTAYLDFSIPANIDSELGLFSMRSELIRHYKMDFSFFDVAYASYLLRTNPNAAIGRELDLYSNSRILGEVLGIAGAKGSEFSDRLFYTVERGKPAVSQWWKNGGGAEFSRLSNENPEFIRKSLIQQWAKDVRNALNGRKCVIMIDSFENIYLSKTLTFSAIWIKELMKEKVRVLDR